MHAPAGRVKALDELLDLPHLNILFCLVLTHFSTDTRRLDSSGQTKDDKGVLGLLTAQMKDLTPNLASCQFPSIFF
jgi:hypothetical protein